MGEQTVGGARRPAAPAIQAGASGPRPVPLLEYLAGLILLGVSVASSLTLAMGHIGALSIPGCGHNSPCAEAAASVWGRVPIIGWPTSFLGFAYFAGALVAWALSRGGLSRWFMAIVRLGVLMSLFFVAIIVIEGHHCTYCLVSHAGNFGFWILAERRRRPACARRRPAGVQVLSVFVVAAGVAGAQWRAQAAGEQRGEQARSESVARIIAAADAPAPGEAPGGGQAPAPGKAPAPGDAPGEQGTRAITPAAAPETHGPEANAQTAPMSPTSPAAPAAPTSRAAAAPAQPPWGAAFRGRYLYGPDPAAIRIVMFTDYQCTDCNRIEDDVRQVLAGHKDVSLSVKHFPMCTSCNKHFDRNMHPNACWAARAAEAAGLLGGNDGFWKMHWWLFDHDGGFTDQELNAGLQELGFDHDEFIRVMTGPETLARVQSDIEEAMWVGIHYTPMIFVNGVELKGFNVRGALERTVAEVERQNPPPRTHTADHPPAAVEKYIDDWRSGGLRNIPADTQPRTLGPADARVEIVVWGDLVEPSTAKADSTIRALVAGRWDVRYNFRQYPVNQACNPVAPRTLFDNACLAAKAAEAAQVLGGPDAYWKMHAWLAQTRDRVDQPGLREAARAQGLDPDRLLAVMDQLEVAAAIEEDCRAGQQMGLTSIPLIVVAGRVVPRWERDGESLLGRMVDLAVGEAGRP